MKKIFMDNVRCDGRAGGGAGCGTGYGERCLWGPLRPVLMAEPRPGIIEIMYESARNSNTPPAIIMETFSVTFDDRGEILRQRMLDVSPPVSKIMELDYLAAHLPEKDYASSYGFGMPHTIVRLNDEGSFIWQTPVSPDWYMIRSIAPTGDGGSVVLGTSKQKKKFFSCGL